GPAPVDDINLNAVRHNPDQETYVSPITSDYVQIRLRVLQGNVTQANLILQGDQAKPIRMHLEEPQFGFDWWAALVAVAKPAEPLRYSFDLHNGDAARRFPAEGQISATVSNRLNIPEWAKNVVWYQIFPDRFRNGTTENDPPHTLPWRWDWYKIAPGET